jgi:PAS domain S-box-containing protein
VSVNRSGAEQLGYTVDELIGRSVLDLFYEADREAVQTHVAACFEPLRNARRWELRKVRKDGTMVYVALAAIVMIHVRPVRAVVGSVVQLRLCLTGGVRDRGRQQDSGNASEHNG